MAIYRVKTRYAVLMFNTYEVEADTEAEAQKMVNDYDEMNPNPAVHKDPYDGEDDEFDVFAVEQIAEFTDFDKRD